MEFMDWQLAQINVGTIRYPQDDPRMHGFMSRLDEINALAEASPGFVWRLQSDSGNATDIDVGVGPLFLVNMSVWESPQALFDYVYKTMHREIMVQRRKWFEKPVDLYQALWWVPAGHTPTPTEGLARVEHLKANGPTSHAFTFQNQFPPSEGDGSDEAAADGNARALNPKEYCSGWE